MIFIFIDAMVLLAATLGQNLIKINLRVSKSLS